MDWAIVSGCGLEGGGWVIAIWNNIIMNLGHPEIKGGIILYQFLGPHKFERMLNNVMFIVFP
jgi:hypothetical protein